MLDTHTLELLQPGPTRASIQAECMSTRPNSASLVTDLDFIRKRVFILGPSHHVYMDGCALSTMTEYATPIGNLPLDLESK